MFKSNSNEKLSFKDTFYYSTKSRPTEAGSRKY